MKKKLLMMAIALVGLTGLTAFAQDSQNNNSNRPTPGQMNKMRQPREFTEFAFEGILLDINQQQRMDSLNAAVRANCPEMSGRECCQNDSTTERADCKKDNCKKGDCQGAQCQNAGTSSCNRGQRSPKDHRMMRRNPYGDEYIAKVKEILTPEQFALFEENISKMPMNMKRVGGCTMKEGAKARRTDNARPAKCRRDRTSQSRTE